jgi:transposase
MVKETRRRQRVAGGSFKKLVAPARNDGPRRDKTARGIAGVQSVPNADTAEQKGDDAGKKVSGIKRHIAAGIMGLPHAPTITTADVTDRQGAVEMTGQNVKNLQEVKKLVAGGGYTGGNFARAVKDLRAAEAGVVKRNELHTFAVLPKRWVAGRRFGWMGAPALEKLRAQIAPFSANGRSGVYCCSYKEILNRLLEPVLKLRIFLFLCFFPVSPV